MYIIIYIYTYMYIIIYIIIFFPFGPLLLDAAYYIYICIYTGTCSDIFLAHLQAG